MCSLFPGKHLKVANLKTTSPDTFNFITFYYTSFIAIEPTDQISLSLQICHDDG